MAYRTVNNIPVQLIGRDLLELHTPRKPKHPKCQGYSDYYGEFDCGYGTTLMCEDCKYGQGRKDPEAKCNQ